MSLPVITLEEFQSCPWPDALSNVTCRIHNYSSAFMRKSEEFDSNSSQNKVLRFLGAICSMMLTEKDNGPVFSPMVVFDSRRSALPEDIPQETLVSLFDFASEMQNHILRARIMDILWVRRVDRRFQAANEAVNSYLTCAKELLYEPYECVPYLRRSLNITYELRKAGIVLREKVCLSFNEAIDKYSHGDLDGLHWRFFSILAERKIGDQKQLVKLMTCAATAYEQKSGFHLMRSFLELAKTFARNSGDSEQTIQAISVRMAESYISEAASRADHPMVQSHFLEQAIQAYRSIGGFDAKIDELHKQMLDVQKTIPNFLTTHTVQLPDMSDIVEQSRSAVTGKGLFEALISFAFIVNPLDPEKERKNAMERAEKYPLQNMFSQRHMDNNGRTVSVAPPISNQDIKEDNVSIYSEMLRSSRLDIHLALYSSILPALQCILEEHAIDELLIKDIINYNQLVPSGRELFFFRGIKAGFEYDFVSASLFLIPQLENSLRNIMEMNGQITSKLMPTGIQREKDLNDLLDEQFIQDFMGDKYTFTLKSLLTEQIGANLRNRLAHGLAEYDQLQGDAAAYFWWFLLRLLLIPIIRQQQDKAKENM